jgi:hypothetical protein
MVAEARSMGTEAPVWMQSDPDPFTLKEAVGSVAHVFHGLCNGPTHCDCQHKVDFEGKSIQKESANGTNN